jgi:hypothetical protein
MSDEMPSTMRAVLTIRVGEPRFNGVWLLLELDRASLLAAVGLPQHEIFREGIFHSFQPELPTHGAQADVDLTTKTWNFELQKEISMFS